VTPTAPTWSSWRRSRVGRTSGRRWRTGWVRLRAWGVPVAALSVVVGVGESRLRVVCRDHGPGPATVGDPLGEAGWVDSVTAARAVLGVSVARLLEHIVTGGGGRGRGDGRVGAVVARAVAGRVVGSAAGRLPNRCPGTAGRARRGRGGPVEHLPVPAGRAAPELTWPGSGGRSRGPRVTGFLRWCDGRSGWWWIGAVRSGGGVPDAGWVGGVDDRAGSGPARAGVRGGPGRGADRVRPPVGRRAAAPPGLIGPPRAGLAEQARGLLRRRADPGGELGRVSRMSVGTAVTIVR